MRSDEHETWAQRRMISFTETELGVGEGLMETELGVGVMKRERQA